MRRQVALVRRYTFAVGVGALVVIVDLLTKRNAATNFSDGVVEVLPGFLSFTFHENPGAAFSLFQNAGVFLGAAAIGIIIFVLIALRIPRPPMETLAFGFILGGALGNLADRLFRGDGLLDGHVIDWVNLSVIPTFNVADAAVTFAVGLLLIQAWRTR